MNQADTKTVHERWAMMNDARLTEEQRIVLLANFALEFVPGMLDNLSVNTIEIHSAPEPKEPPREITNTNGEVLFTFDYAEVLKRLDAIELILRTTDE